MAIAIFPDAFAAGARIGWEGQETIITYYGGQEQVALDWPFPKAIASFSTPFKDNSFYNTVLDLYETHGLHTPFLVKLRSEYSFTDELMGGTADGVNDVFSLQVSKTVGNKTLIRPIDYPDDATLVVEDDGVPITVSSRDKRDCTVTPVPANGSVMTATFEFRRLMRFVDRISASVGQIETSGSVDSIRLREVFEFT